ncbi:unnamed protein product [Prunus armeniaca]
MVIGSGRIGAKNERVFPQNFLASMQQLPPPTSLYNLENSIERKEGCLFQVAVQLVVVGNVIGENGNFC